jgi:hypothetical protein
MHSINTHRSPTHLSPARSMPARLQLASAALVMIAAPHLHAQRPRARAPISDMRIMRPVVVQVIAQEQWERDESCVVRRVWHGRLSPTDATGKRVSGRLAYFDFYTSHQGTTGCAVYDGERRVGTCDLQNRAQYDVVADVSAIEVPEDANGSVLGALASGRSAVQRAGPNAPPGRRVLRPRLTMRAALVRGTLVSSNPCLTTTADQGATIADALAGQWIPFPPFFVSTETESGRPIPHWLGGKNAIWASAWWTAGLRDVPDGQLAVSGRDPDPDDVPVLPLGSSEP